MALFDDQDVTSQSTLAASPRADARTVAVASFVATFAYVVLYQLQSEVIMPFQQDQLGLTWATFPIIALAHGLRIMVAWMFGWYAALILLPALGCVILFQFGLSLPPAGILLAYCIILISAPFSITVLGFFGVAARAVQDPRTWWRAILLVGIMSSVINSVAVHSLIPFGGTPQEAINSLILGMFAGVAGLVVVAMALLMFFRRAR